MLSLLSGFLLLSRSRAEELLDLTNTLQVQPGANKHNSKVEDDVRPEYAVVSPDVGPVHIKGCCKGISISILTETAKAVGLGDDIAA